jgi:hypothetical protein
MTQKLWTCASVFFGKMVAKMIHQSQSHGYSGRDYSSESYLIEKLNRNIQERDWVDVANLAMMLDYHDKHIYREIQ